MERADEIVVLLHGIGCTPRSLGRIERRLRHAGFRTANIAYPSRRMNVAHLADFVADVLKARKLCEEGVRLHVVTHSMGGLVAAHLLDKHIPAARIGRVVMLAPPIGGSEVADALSGLTLYNWFYGPAGLELTTTSDVLADIRVDYSLGIIAGNGGWFYPSGRLWIAGAHDGRVSVERTRLAGMTDHLVLPLTHSLMPVSRRVQKQVLHFLETGAFARS